MQLNCHPGERLLLPLREPEGGADVPLVLRERAPTRVRLRSRDRRLPVPADRGGVAAGRHVQAQVLQEVRRVGQVGGLRGNRRRVLLPVRPGGNAQNFQDDSI